MEEMTKKNIYEWFKVCCVDFWGEKKTQKKIKEAWEDLLNALREDGEKVPDYKLTAIEIKECLEI